VAGGDFEHLAHRFGVAYFINADSFAAIWTMFGIANQMLAVIALAVVTVVLVREGKGEYFGCRPGR